jgi:phosphoenolpyruvate---glycerone phosphotransferase subunit DhaL
MSVQMSIPAPAFARALLFTCDRVDAAKDELCLLDAVAGDGDLGATLASGFMHVRAALEDSGLDQGDIGALLKQAGSVLARKAPSTIGALLATAFMRAGGELNGCTELDAGQAARLLRSASDAVAERGRVVVGQRTVVDAMAPAAEAGAEASRRSSDPVEVFRAAAAAASLGAEATAEMEPVVGRAGWIADRARGHADAGATAWAIIVAAIAEELESEAKGSRG